LGVEAADEIPRVVTLAVALDVEHDDARGALHQRACYAVGDVAQVARRNLHTLARGLRDRLVGHLVEDEADGRLRDAAGLGYIAQCDSPRTAYAWHVCAFYRPLKPWRNALT